MNERNSLNKWDNIVGFKKKEKKSRTKNMSCPDSNVIRICPSCERHCTTPVQRKKILIFKISEVKHEKSCRINVFIMTRQLFSCFFEIY